MTAANVSPEAAVMYATALADSILDTMPREWRAVAALNIKAHVRDIRSRQASENGITPAHSECEALLQSFFERLTDKQQA